MTLKIWSLSGEQKSRRPMHKWPWHRLSPSVKPRPKLNEEYAASILRNPRFDITVCGRRTNWREVDLILISAATEMSLLYTARLACVVTKLLTHNGGSIHHPTYMKHTCAQVVNTHVTNLHKFSNMKFCFFYDSIFLKFIKGKAVSKLEHWMLCFLAVISTFTTLHWLSRALTCHCLQPR